MVFIFKKWLSQTLGLTKNAANLIKISSTGSSFYANFADSEQNSQATHSSATGISVYSSGSKSNAKKEGMQKYLGFLKKIRNLVRPTEDDTRGLLEKMRDQYRLVIMNDETFEEVSSMKLTPLRVYIFLSSLVVGTAILMAALIIYTPLKRYIPGYGDIQRNDEIEELTAKVAGLENEIKAHRTYNENFRKLLVGDMTDFSEEAAKEKGKTNKNDTEETQTNKNVARSIEDEALRVAVAEGTFSGGGEAASGINPVLIREKTLEQHVFMPPVSGEVMATFDLQKNHFGVDIAAPKNTAVKSAADGVVISSGYTVETGYSIAIQHPNNVVTMYKHNSVLLKKAGSSIKAGEAIAIIGNSGENTSGPHLHFELWHKGRAMNPSDYINFN
jgi:murein DD-endopeptidase MepM/ murein hydrolase activator NlpD